MSKSAWRRAVHDLVDRLGGGKIEVTGGGHLKIQLDIGGGPIFTSGTPSDHRSFDNLRAMLRRVHRLAQAQKAVIA